MRLRSLSAFLFLPTIFVLASACGGEGDPEADAEGTEKPYVEIVEAREGSVPLEERVSGIIRAENQVSIRAEIEAPVVEVLVRNGQAVRKGQPLVRLDPETLRDQARQAQAALEVARASVVEASSRVTEIESRAARLRSLAAENLISQQDIDTLDAELASARATAAQERARVSQAEATLAERSRALERSVIRAPISGTVGRRNAEVGMIARPSDILFVIGDLEELIVEVPLTEEMLGYVRQGQAVRIHSARLDGGSVEGILSRISPFLETASFSTVGEIDIPNPGQRLQPGMFVQVDLLYGESEHATLVPTSALWEDPASGDMTAWIVTDPRPAGTEPDDTATVERRKISVIGEGRLAAAVGGVQPGEWVVVLGQHLFREPKGEARLRSTTWERVAELQNLQREDLLADYLAKQQRLAEMIGKRPLGNEEFLGSGAPIDPNPVVPADGGL